MTLVIPSGFAQVVFNFAGPAALGSSPKVVLGVVQPADGGALVSAVTGWCNDLSGEMSNEYVIDSVTFLDATTTFDVVVGDAGAHAGAASPPNICVLCHKGTGVRGRKNRGRSYWPGLLMDDSVADSGSIESGRLGTLAILMASLTSALDGAGSQQVILHTDNSTPTPVTDYTVEGYVATQRRRLRK